ncbi:hypothetical protein [Leptospira stimsonii]|uniref:Uncharacterized protein n=1 Tax=Leptospira stimsonii TaxID=2202203 RepID=A0A8B3CNR2_9LEPT|nr:hypothetical protein [Leptospira stimsonii]RHX83776.1 hypothetical protein DLM78_19985 [Leptospira stimsonii]
MSWLNRIFKKSNPPKNPEDEFIVTFNEESVRVEHPRRKTEQIAWKEIEEIRLINTDAGPFAPDIWLALIGKNSDCLIPSACEGYDRVYEIVSKYEGFHFEKVIQSMSTAENAEFLLWKK